jgi:predicted MFS family arabinose efflux permease
MPSVLPPLGAVLPELLLALSAIVLLLIGAFLLIEGKLASAPLMPLRLFSSRTLSAANVIVLMLGAAMFGMWYFISLYLQQVLGFSPIEAGLSFLPMPLSILIFSTLASRAVARVGVKPLLVAGMLLQAVGLLLFAEISPEGSYFPHVFVPGVIVASGMGMAFAPVTIAAVAGVDPSEAGLASGLVNTSRQMGGALGLAILATIATSRTDAELADGFSPAHALTDGFHRAFEVGAGFALVGALVALLALPSVRVRARAAQREAARAEASSA